MISTIYVYILVYKSNSNEFVTLIHTYWDNAKVCLQEIL